MKYRVIIGSVTVTGPPPRICLSKRGTTLPADPRTLPNRTVIKAVVDFASLNCATISAIRLLTPIMLVGLTALSVEIRMNFSTPLSTAARAATMVPTVLLRIVSRNCAWSIGTCL